MRKRGFTLLEAIVVLVIIGILASMGLAKYFKSIRNSVKAEANSNLAALRRMQIAYYDQYGAYGLVYSNAGGDVNQLGVDLPLGYALDPVCSNSGFYYEYFCGVNGQCCAMRCNSGGKNPQGQTATSHICIDPDGSMYDYD